MEQIKIYSGIVNTGGYRNDPRSGFEKDDMWCCKSCGNWNINIRTLTKCCCMVDKKFRSAYYSCLEWVFFKYHQHQALKEYYESSTF